MKFFNYIVITPEEDFEVTSRDRLFVISPEYPDIDNLINGEQIIIKMKIYFLLMSLLVILKYIIKQLKKKKEIRRQIKK